MRSYIKLGLSGPGAAGPQPEKIPIEDYGWRPDIGDRKTFAPAALALEHQSITPQSIFPDLDLRVTGTVVQVHEAHRWYRVRFETPHGPQHECFKF